MIRASFLPADMYCPKNTRILILRNSKAKKNINRISILSYEGESDNVYLILIPSGVNDHTK